VAELIEQRVFLLLRHHLATRGLGALIEEHSHLPTEELRERVLREIAAFVGSAPQHDDMTMLLIRVGQPTQTPGAMAGVVPVEARS